MLHWSRDLLMGQRGFTDEEAETNAWQTDGMYEQHVQRSIWQRHRRNAAVMLPNYTPPGWYECDMFIVLKSGFTIEYEIKTSHGDFKADSRKRDKHARLTARRGRGVPNRFFYAIPAMLVYLRDIPDYAGVVFLTWTTKERWKRLSAPRITVIRNAPRLNESRMSSYQVGNPSKLVQHMRHTAYWRFWNERFRFEDYRRDVKRADWVAKPP